MAHSSAWGFDTLQIHAGTSPEPVTGARIPPIFASTSFVYESIEEAAASFRLEGDGYDYSRIANPTNTVVENRIAALEGGVSAVLTASGQAATALALLNLARSGDHIVASSQLYGGSTNLLLKRFAELGIDVTLVSDLSSLEDWQSAVRPNTRAFFAESIGNPLGSVLDIPAVAKIAHASGVPLVVDNTLATPYLMQPLAHGADIVVHSTTKYLAGHGRVIGGVVVSGGQFAFDDADRWPGFHHADLGHGDAGYWERFGPLAYTTRLRSLLLRDYGPAPSPFNSFLLLQGIETLSLRMRQHVSNANAVVAFLEQHPAVERVYYPTATGQATSEVAGRLLPRGGGGIVSFEIAGGIDAGARFVEGVQLISHLANIGDVRTLILHPASTINSGLTAQQRANAGVRDGLIRLSIGIEDSDDIIADLGRGFASAGA
ncbi:MAG TPA: aminotransferase class V-fold PLP-dependent enzyme [Microbacteriaceae bacterium]|nr:aminotransferase class V-fold PLP-dependent enzyme [Microbacteriaceae bacterium]